jgi:hypothetical protein
MQVKMTTTTAAQTMHIVAIFQLSNESALSQQTDEEIKIRSKFMLKTA